MEKIAKIFLSLVLVCILLLQSTAVFAFEVLEGKEPIEETLVTTDNTTLNNTTAEENTTVDEVENVVNTEEVVTSENTDSETAEIAEEKEPVEEVEEKEPEILVEAEVSKDSEKVNEAEVSEEAKVENKEDNEIIVKEELAEEVRQAGLEVDKEELPEEDIVGAEYYDGNVSYIYYRSDDIVKIVARGKYITEAVVPAYVNIDGVNKKVTQVGGFDGCTDLKKVTLPSTVTTICRNAFDGCTALTSINIPNSVTIIENQAFKNCSSLKSITLPSSVTTIGEYAFENIGITNIIIPNSVTELKVGAFYNCSLLKSATLSNKLTEIKAHVFRNTVLQSISIPSSVTRIEHSAFANTKLSSVTIPANVTEMVSPYWSDEFGIFQNCTSLTTINILGKIQNLPTSIFRGCTALTNVTLPSTITSTGNKSFYGCTALKTITLPNDLKNISIEMFYGCSNLTNIKLPNNLEVVERSAFADCAKLPTISFPYKVHTFNGPYWSDEKGTFQGCNNLDSIYFTKSIQEVDSRVFKGLDYCTIYGYEGSAAKSIAEANGYRYVQLNPVTSVSVTGNKVVAKGTSTTLKAIVGPTSAYNKNIVWSSSNDSVATVDANGKVTGVKTGTATITAMATDGTGVRGTFNVTVSLTDLPFNDVTGDAWYYNAVKYVYTNKIIMGTSSTTFAPADKLQRGMLVTILYRMEGQPKVSGKVKFADVSSKQYYYNAVKWATDKKIVNGYKNGKFGPEDNITRQDLAVILYNYAKYRGKNLSKTNNLAGFSDKGKVASYATTQMKWAVGAGVITGNTAKNGTKTINPNGQSTRAEAAAMIEKYCKSVGR